MNMQPSQRLAPSQERGRDTSVISGLRILCSSLPFLVSNEDMCGKDLAHDNVSNDNAEFKALPVPCLEAFCECIHWHNRAGRRN